MVNEEGLMYHIHLKKGDIGRYVLLPGDPFRTDLIATYFDEPKLIAHNREHKTWVGKLDGVPVAVTSTGMGCPSAAIALEELIKCGADTFIRVGTAGRVCDAAYDETLDGVINTAAVRDEGTTIHYIPIEYPAVADRHVVDALAVAAKNLGYHYAEGITQSKDSFYGQHEPENMPAESRLKERWEAWRRGNVMTSEMEAAALFVISSIRGMPRGIYHVVRGYEKNRGSGARRAEDSHPAGRGKIKNLKGKQGCAMSFRDYQKENSKQYHIQVAKGEVGRYVFLPGDPFRTDLIASFLDGAKLVAHNREHKTWTGRLDGEMVSVTSTGMGCPSTAIAVEELIKCGADTFIRIGTAGPVRDEADSERYDGVVVTGAVRDEGTTVHYIPVEYPAVADRHVVAALAQAAQAAGLNFAEGISQSKDSFYGEVDPACSPAEKRLKERWEAWRRGNVMCSEMECAALFVISSIRGCRAGAIMNWGDMNRTIQTACDAVRLLIQRDKIIKCERGKL